MKRFWTFIKHKRSDGNEIPPLQNGGLLHSDPVEKANILNNQFQSAFSEKSGFTKTDSQKRCNSVLAFLILCISFYAWDLLISFVFCKVCPFSG
jgi:hypothetical protein